MRPVTQQGGMRWNLRSPLEHAGPLAPVPHPRQAVPGCRCLQRPAHVLP